MNNVVLGGSKYVVEPNYFGPKARSYSIAAHWKFTLRSQTEVRLVTVSLHRDYIHPILVVGMLSGHRSFSNSLALIRPITWGEDSIEQTLGQLISLRSQRVYHQVAAVSKNRVLLGVKGWKRFEHLM